MLEEKGAEAKKKHLETERKGARAPDGIADSGSSHTQKARQGENSEGGEDTLMDAGKSPAKLSHRLAQIPATQTQIYLAAVAAFLSQHPHQTGGNDRADTSELTQR